MQIWSQIYLRNQNSTKAIVFSEWLLHIAAGCRQNYSRFYKIETIQLVSNFEPYWTSKLCITSSYPVKCSNSKFRSFWTEYSTKSCWVYITATSKLAWSKLWNQVPSLDHFVVQNSGDFLCWKYKEVVFFYVSNLRQ